MLRVLQGEALRREDDERALVLQGLDVHLLRQGRHASPPVGDVREPPEAGAAIQHRLLRVQVPLRYHRAPVRFPCPHHGAHHLLQHRDGEHPAGGRLLPRQVEQALVEIGGAVGAADEAQPAATPPLLLPRPRLEGVYLPVEPVLPPLEEAEERLGGGFERELERVFARVRVLEPACVGRVTPAQLLEERLRAPGTRRGGFAPARPVRSHLEKSHGP